MKKFQQLWLEQINQIIDENLQNPDLQLSDIVDKLEISPTTFYRTMKKLTGTSPNKYIRARRLEKAKNILEVGVYPTVKETAFSVGFRSSDYFSKQFYNEYKVLPKQLLKDKD